MPDEDLIEEPEDGADATVHTRSSADVGEQLRAARARKVLAGNDQDARTAPPQGRSTKPTTRT